MPAHQGDVHPALLDRPERVVSADQADGGPGGPLEPRDGVLCPRIGQQPAESEAHARLLPDRVDATPQLGQDPLDVTEEDPPGRGGRHVARSAVQQRRFQRVFELFDGSAQRGLGDAEFLRGQRERFEARHRFERAEVTQLDSAGLHHVHAR